MLLAAVVALVLGIALLVRTGFRKDDPNNYSLCDATTLTWMSTAMALVILSLLFALIHMVGWLAGYSL